MTSIPKPDLIIPTSDATVDVKIIDGGRLTVPAAATYVWGPVLPGHEKFSAMSYAFFIENHAKKKRIMFDLGLRKDPENYAPVHSNFLKDPTKGAIVEVDKDVATQLQEGGIDLKSVDAIVWSHTHFDHIGDPSIFPHSTELVVGPGISNSILPPYPENPQGLVLATDFEGRKMTELGDAAFTIEIGGFKAHDYFGDGSFYLLNVPGHATGHIAGLARVTSTTFVFLGADTCHHAAMLRPNPNIHTHFPCPGHLISNSISHQHFPVIGGSTDISSREQPLLAPKATNYADLEKSKESIALVATNFDAHPDVFVLLAHDTSLEDVVEAFPASLNQWKEKGWKERVVWAFLEEDGPAFMFKPKIV